VVNLKVLSSKTDKLYKIKIKNM